MENKIKSGDLAVVYARYSSHSQGEQSIEGQLSEAKKYAAAHGYTIVHEYIDRAKTGRTDNRGEFQRMLRDTAKKQFSVVIVWKVDRFGRNREEIAINKMRCRKNGVRVEYVAETIPQTPEGVILESVLEGFAEYYSLQLSQNIRRGRAESAEKCQSLGGAHPLGYTVGADKKYAIDEATAPTVRMIYTMYADGKTVTQIVKELNRLGLRTRYGKPFTNNSLGTILKNKKYIGIYEFEGREVADGIPRIISDDLFYKVQAMLKINQRAPVRTWSYTEYLLSDKIFCGKCGAPMFGECGTSGTGARHTYYNCSNKKRFHACTKKAVRQADIEETVIRATLALLHDDDLLNQIIEHTWEYYLQQDNRQEELKRLQKLLGQTDTAISNLIRAIEVGILTEETKARMDELTQQKADLKASIADQQIANGYRLQKSHIEYYLKNLRNGDASNREVQKKLIQTFVNAVFVFDDHLKLTYNFSGDKSTVTLQDLKDSESGEKFAYRALCSTNLNTPQKILCGVFFCIYAKIFRALCTPGYRLLPALLAAALDCKNGHPPAFSISLKAKRTHCRLDPAKQCVRFFKKHPRKIAVSFRAEIPYFKKPFTICSSASFSFKPKVISLISCSPAILPIAASWIRLASTQLAESWGLASTRASSIIIESHSVWPAQAALPFSTLIKCWVLLSLATVRLTTLQLQPSPSRSAVMSETAFCSPVVITFSRITRLEPAFSLALVLRSVSSMPEIWVISISSCAPSSRYTIVVGFITRLPRPSPSP